MSKIIVLTSYFDLKVNSNAKDINSKYIKVYPVNLEEKGQINYGRTVRLCDVEVSRRIATPSKREDGSIPLVIKVSSETNIGNIFMNLNQSYMRQVKQYLDTGVIKPKNNSKDAKNIKSMFYKGVNDDEGVLDLFPVLGKTGRQAWSNTKFHTFARVNGKNRDVPFREEINEENFHEYFYKGMVIPIVDVDFSQVVSSSKGFKCAISIRKIITNYEKKEDTMEIPDDIFDRYYVEPEKEPEKEPEPESDTESKETEFEDVESALSRLNVEMS